MRLDEWQKYIDSQFLDEEPEPTPAPKASKIIEKSVTSETLPKDTATEAAEAEIITQEALFTAVFADEPDPSAPSAVASSDPAPNVVQNMVTMVVATPPSPALPVAGRTPRVELLTPLPETVSETKPVILATEEVTNRTRRRSQVPESSSVPDADTVSEVPAASSNIASSELPVSKIDLDLNTAERNVPKPNAAPIQSTPTRELLPLASGLFEPISDLDTDIPVFQRYLPSSHVAALPTASPPPLGLQTPLPFLSETSDDSTTDNIEDNAAEQDDLLVDSSLERARRAPKSRARHARNVRPENVPSGLSATKLWAAVPRHVQTLLSLERLEEKEVAQFSYKRQFQEKRHELIERLLDPILSLEDTARLLNVCPTTVRRYTNKGILTYYRKEPERNARSGSETAVVNEKETRQRRFRLSDILAFLETQQAAIESDRQAEHQAERRRLARASSTLAAPLAEPDSVSNVPNRGKDS